MCKELKDVADKVTNLEDILFPKDRSKCNHIVLGELFFKTDNGCTMQCANCGTLVKNKCERCAIGELLLDKETGLIVTVLPCDGYKMKKEDPGRYG